MIIPEKIKVGGLTYDVVIIDKMEDNTCAAFIDIQKCIIKLEAAAPQAMEHNFLHELIHAMNSELKEETVEFITMILYGIIKDNPKVFGGGEQKNGRQK